jgi:hypothetical protein
MNKSKTKTLISILTAVIMLLIPIVSMASDPPALLPKTGQTTVHADYDDGYYQTGISNPNPRFTDNTDGTVTDEKTGLVWLKNANCFGTRAWANALTDSNTLNSGECGLTDGSAEDKWRAPNVMELQSLIDFGNYGPALPTGHPFTNVQTDVYWSSTTYVAYGTGVWRVALSTGKVESGLKTGDSYTWPVRGGN